MRTIKYIDIVNPQVYKGFASFHKYWGKKPIEYFLYLIEQFTAEGDIVIDPFLGYGLLAREVALRNRRFIGIDINPISIQLATLFLDLPDFYEYMNLFRELEYCVKPKIDQSYMLIDGDIASHFLWEGDIIKLIWKKSLKGRKRIELVPTSHDYQTYNLYRDYIPKYIRDMHFFTNSRINASSELKIQDIFTGRALRNIEILLEYINKQPTSLQRSFLLTLTAASGQMSKMVFAINRRGRSKGNIEENDKSNNKIEVGSWGVGYWRPNLHFEINVWNCFENRVHKLLKIIKNIDCKYSGRYGHDLASFFERLIDICLINDDAYRVLKVLPNNSISLVITDPPHGDRIPYLELSEMWNALLGQFVDFEKEIIVSNARERNKNKEQYNKQLYKVFKEAYRVCCDGGLIVIVFNARDTNSWEYLRRLKELEGLQYRGCFPLKYSTYSVMQDNRQGSLKYDYVLIYQKSVNYQISSTLLNKLDILPGWQTTFPKI